VTKKNAPPAFQCYAGDFLADTQGCLLSAKGAHIQFRCYAWLRGPVPLDPDRRALILGVKRTEADKAWAEIEHLWRETPAGFVEDAIEAQRSEKKALSQLNSLKGQASAAARRAHREATARATGAQPRLQPERPPNDHRDINRAATERQPEAQPNGNSSDFRLLDQTQDQDQRPAAAVRPVETVENAVTPRFPRDLHEPTMEVFTKLAHTILDDVEAGKVEQSEIWDEIKCRAASAHLNYAAMNGQGDQLCQQAMQSALRQRRNRVVVR
jgi:hypothetical protein